jgi:hypothetical protein
MNEQNAQPEMTNKVANTSVVQPRPAPIFGQVRTFAQAIFSGEYLS